MKLKNKFSLLILIISFIGIITFTGCNKTIYHWEIDKSIEEIDSIEMVNIENSMITEIICEIDRESYQEIINDIESLEATKYGWSLCQPFGISVRIKFFDGNVDIISLWETRHATFMENGAIKGEISWLHIDNDQYSKFIEKWLSIAQNNP